MTIEIPMMRNSERKSFKTCQAAWYWGWVEGWKPANELRGAAWYGSLLHIALAEHYRPGKTGFDRSKPLLEAWEELTKDLYMSISSGRNFGDSEEQEFYNAKQLGITMLTGYEKKWGNDGHWEVLLPESRFAAKIAYTKEQIRRILENPFMANYFPNGKHITRLVGTFDMPVRDHSFDVPQIVVVDHKSTNRREDVKMLSKDDQAGTYISVAEGVLRHRELIRKDEHVVGAVFNYLRKALPKDDAVRDELGRVRNKPKKEHFLAAFAELPEFTIDSKTPLSQLEAIAKGANITVYGDISKNQGVDLFWRIPVLRNKYNRARQRERIAEDAEHMALVRNGALPVMKSPGDHCNWCSFNALCDVDENGGDTEQFKKDAMMKVDMYADHRQGAINSKESVEASKIAKLSESLE